MRIRPIRAARTATLVGVAALIAMSSSPFSLAQSIEVIVDNRDANTSRIGTWKTSSGINPFAGDSLYNSDGGSFSWFPVLPEPGNYDIYAWWTHNRNRSSLVPYRIFVDEQPSVAILADQQDPDLGGQWNLLGTFSFSDGSIPKITVSSENGQASADAIRLVFRPQPPPPATWPATACPCDKFIDRAIADLTAAGNRFTASEPGLRDCGGSSSSGFVFFDGTHEEFPQTRADEAETGADLDHDASLARRTQMRISLEFQFRNDTGGQLPDIPGFCIVTTDIDWPPLKSTGRHAPLTTLQQFDACQSSIQDLCDRWHGPP